MARGEFDNLPGAGQPINLEEYFQTPEEFRMAYSVLKSARCLPEEVELLNEIGSLDRELGAAGSDEARAAIRRRLRDRRLQLAIALERRRMRKR